MIEVENTSEKREKISYDVLAICTGANFCLPWSGKFDSLDTAAGRQAEFDKVREDINSANSILCVGAGSTGIETAGYLKEKHPDKKIGIALRGNVICKNLNGAHKVAEKLLTEMGVVIHYNSEIRDGKF